MAKGNFLKTLRIGLLLVVLAGVGFGTLLTRQRVTSWEHPLWVAVYPINGDGSDAVDRYITNLDEETFEPIERFLKREAERYGISMRQPVEILLRDRLNELPPPPPRDGNVPAIMWWSLKLRWFAHRVRTDDDIPARIAMFVIYVEPTDEGRILHSLGLQEGLVGVVNAPAGESARNNVVIAHEMLHTLGASDKYVPGTMFPRHPDGLADPTRKPLYPQRRAEIMAGRIPVSANTVREPKGLNEVVVGQQTAQEIRWIR